MTQNIINVKDTIEGIGEITKISEKSVFFGEKRFNLNTFLKKSVKVINYQSSDKIIDWTNPKEVDSYYATFKNWAGVIRMGDSKTSVILEVKDNKVFFEGEYYLPFYSNGKDKKFIADGFIFGFCLKLKNTFWGHTTDKTVNVFYVEDLISKDSIQYNEIKTTNKKNLNNIDYLKNLDFSSINSQDLDLIRNNYIDLFDKSIFPYTINNVTFKIGNFNRIEVSHRNRTGYIRINNSYKGRTPFKNDYGLIVEVSPYFTNECQYTDSVRVEGNVKFDINMLNSLSAKVVSVWDKAIENNAKNYNSYL